MKCRPIVPLVMLVLALSAALLFSGGCANILPPSGGPRDSLPPVLLKAFPADSTLEFAGKTIRFEFDEFVEVDNYLKNLIISPVPEDMPTVSRKLQTITVKLREDLEPNTTYSFNFGNSIRDLNEGNVYRNFTYLLSTGNYFDSLQFAGSVLLAQSGDIDTTMMVMLHRSSEDSALTTMKPRYVTRVDNQGKFRFKNLPPGTFYLYALKDESGTYRYFSPESQLFAFASEPVRVYSDSVEPAKLLAYQLPGVKEAPKTQEERRGREEKRLKFSANLKASQQDLLSPFVFQFEKPVRNFDSSKIVIATDTLYTPVAAGYSWTADSTFTKWTLQIPWKENTLYHLILDKEFATDTLGQQLLKSDTLSFFTKKITDYGKLNLRFRNLDLSNNPVLQFVQNKEVVYSFPLTSNTLTQPLFMPGEYNLRILRDTNGNGVWDPGNFFGEKRQPEVAEPLARTVNVKPGQDFPIEIDVLEKPASDTPGTGPGNRRPTRNP